MRATYDRDSGRPPQLVINGSTKPELVTMALCPSNAGYADTSDVSASYDV